MSTPVKRIPKFTLEQVEWLDTVFPEITDTNTTTDKLLINLGSRRVVKTVQNQYEAARKAQIKELEL